MERSLRSPLTFTVLTLCLLCLTFISVGSASARGVTVKVIASPKQVQENQNVTLTASIENVGNPTFASFNATVIIPRGWSQSLHRPQALGSVAYVLGKAGSGNYSLGSMALNQTFILQVDVKVPAGTPAGNYTVFVITNPKSPGIGQTSTTVAVSVVGPSALPLGGAAVPVSLILILLPGFVTLMLVLWVIGRSIDLTWQAGLAATLLSFFVGFLEWSLGAIPFGGASNLVGTILNLDLFTISIQEIALVAFLAVVFGIVGGWAVLLLNGGKHYLEDRFVLYTRGYIDNNEKVWKDLLKTATEAAIKQFGGAWAPVVSITTTDDLTSHGGVDEPKPGGSPKPKPHVTTVETKTRTDSDDDTDEWKGVSESSHSTSTTRERKRGITSTESQTTEVSPPSPPKVSHVAGLLYSFDDTDPFDIVVGPQYEVWFQIGSPGWKEVSKMIGWDLKNKGAGKWDEGERKEWEEAVSKFKFGPNFAARMSGILAEHGRVRPSTGSAESEPPGEAPSAARIGGAEASMKLISSPASTLFPTPAASDEPTRFVGARKWIRHSEVLAVDVFSPQPAYVFRLI